MTIAIVTPLLFFLAASIMLQNQQGWDYTHVSLTHYRKKPKQNKKVTVDEQREEMMKDIKDHSKFSASALSTFFSWC